MFRMGRQSEREVESGGKALRPEGNQSDLMTLNLSLLFTAGILPTENIASSYWRLRLYRAYPVIMVLLYLLVLTAQCLAVYRFWGDLDAMTDTAFTMVGVFMCHVQAFYVVTNSDKILQLVDTLQNKMAPPMKTLASRDERSYLIRTTAYKTRLLTWTMFVIVHGMLLSWIAIPIIHRYSDGPEQMNVDPHKPSPYFCFIIWLPFNATQSPVYEIVYSVQTLCFLMSCLYYTSVNTVFMTFIIHTATQFKILIISLKDIDYLFPVQSLELEGKPLTGLEHEAEGYRQDPKLSNMIELNDYFIECIKYHKAIIR
jgi:hypothetical protein